MKTDVKLCRRQKGRRRSLINYGTRQVVNYGTGELIILTGLAQEKCALRILHKEIALCQERGFQNICEE